MASKNGKTNGRKSPTTELPDTALSLSQDQLQAFIGLTDVLLKGAEELRRCQMEAAHQAHERHEQVQTLVAKARKPTDLYDLQVELLRFDLDASGKYWQRVAAICAETQANTMNLLNHAASTLGGDVAKLLPVAAQAMAQPKEAETAAPEAPHGADVTQLWNQWINVSKDLGKQWTDMMYRAEGSLH